MGYLGAGELDRKIDMDSGRIRLVSWYRCARDERVCVWASPCVLCCFIIIAWPSWSPSQYKEPSNLPVKSTSGSVPSEVTYSTSVQERIENVGGHMTDLTRLAVTVLFCFL